MNQIKGFSIGFSNFFKAIPFIFKNKLWWTLFIPILLGILLLSAGLFAMDSVGDYLSGIIDGLLKSDNNSDFVNTLINILGGITKFIVKALFFIVFYYLNGYIILIVLSPLFAWLSERTDQILNDNNYPFEWKQFFKDIWRGIVIAIRNLSYEIGVTLLVIIINLIPVINFISAPLSIFFLFFLTAYFYGFSYMDYTNERNRLNVKQSISLIKKYKGVAIGNGTLFSLTLLIPIIGPIVGGLSAIIATVGATLSMYELPEVKNHSISKTN